MPSLFLEPLRQILGQTLAPRMRFFFLCATQWVCLRLVQRIKGTITAKEPSAFCSSFFWRILALDITWIYEIRAHDCKRSVARDICGIFFFVYLKFGLKKWQIWLRTSADDCMATAIWTIWVTMCPYWDTLSPIGRPFHLKDQNCCYNDNALEDLITFYTDTGWAD